MTTKENLVKAPAQRVRRSPVEGRHRLKLRGKGEDPNYHYRLINDTDDRIGSFLDAGWEFVTDEEIRIGDSKVDETTPFGKARVVSVGGGLKAYLMKQKREWYEEDQAAKQALVDKHEQAMRPNPDGQYGKIEVTRK
jgi:hypothetical protein